MNQPDNTGRRPAAKRRRRFGPVVMLLAAVAALLAIALAQAESPRHVTHTVEMKAFAFQPDTVRAAVGDTIVWINRDVVPHTATADAWDSGVMKTADRWQMVVEDEGDVAYLCALHPAMKGTLIVR